MADRWCLFLSLLELGAGKKVFLLSSSPLRFLCGWRLLFLLLLLLLLGLVVAKWFLSRGGKFPDLKKNGKKGREAKGRRKRVFSGLKGNACSTVQRERPRRKGGGGKVKKEGAERKHVVRQTEFLYLNSLEKKNCYHRQKQYT